MKGSRKRALLMSDLAKMAGVSKSTVSRALAGSDLVNKETRALIQKLAAEHNYRINTNARNFFLQNSLTIAVLLPSANKGDWRISDPFFLELLGGIAEAVNEKGHQLLLAKTHPQTGNWIEDFINAHTTDGVILIGQGSQHQKINEIAEHFKGLSVWGAEVDDGQHYATVGSDNELGGYKATRHLIDQGRRHIVFLGYTTLPEVSLRHAGYQRALLEVGLPIDKQLERPARHSRSAGYASTKKLIEAGVTFDAIFAVSDLFAMAAITALQEEGIRVPEDVAVVGYDDVAISAFYNPPLTSIRQDRTEGGRLLVDNLLAAIDGETPPCRVLDTELIVRKSSGG
ncbi:LacI family transcriptional regulator [Exilibacterium tricleocarpae]|uniref:LacI family transcriptional regulator n=1 Tax=Exilibacterium tricleocarpae TaxID=2591008 RepID=A0A545U5Y5_9GAMM|nr:substrate-binding domain-containing protein [Exilibacterium tricleocarpae]TQV84813.1 LacI family transcriptional regulator [Exilibacterium tricleocarpae]